MNTSVMIKTFERPEACQRLINSVRRFYPDIPIIVVDDSREKTEYVGATKIIFTEFDIGVSAGRNIGLANVKTKYAWCGDDDSFFIKETNLELAEQLMEKYEFDILGFSVPGLTYHGFLKQEGSVLTYIRGGNDLGDGVLQCDIIPNLMLARTATLTKYPWDDRLKIGDHLVPYHKYLGKIKVGFTERLQVRHDHVSNPNYQEYRQRALGYIKQYMKESGITKRIDFYGDVIQI